MSNHRGDLNFIGQSGGFVNQKTRFTISHQTPVLHSAGIKIWYRYLIKFRQWIWHTKSLVIKIQGFPGDLVRLDERFLGLIQWGVGSNRNTVLIFHGNTLKMTETERQKIGRHTWRSFEFHDLTRHFSIKIHSVWISFWIELTINRSIGEGSLGLNRHITENRVGWISIDYLERKLRLSGWLIDAGEHHTGIVRFKLGRNNPLGFPFMFVSRKIKSGHTVRKLQGITDFKNNFGIYRWQCKTNDFCLSLFRKSGRTLIDGQLMDFKIFDVEFDGGTFGSTLNLHSTLNLLSVFIDS